MYVCIRWSGCVSRRPEITRKSVSAMGMFQGAIKYLHKLFGGLGTFYRGKETVQSDFRDLQWENTPSISGLADITIEYHELQKTCTCFINE